MNAILLRNRVEEMTTRFQRLPLLRRRKKSSALSPALLELGHRAPIAYLFLERLAYLGEVPKEFFHDWMTKRYQDCSVGQIHKEWLDGFFLTPKERPDSIRVDPLIRRPLVREIAQRHKSQHLFREAFQELKDWVVKDESRRRSACAASIFLAKEQFPELWDGLDRGTRSSLCQFAAKSMWSKNLNLESSIELLNEALTCSSEEERKQISLDLDLVKAFALHEKMFDLLHLMIYLPSFSISFFSFFLGVTQEESEALFEELVTLGIIRNSNFIEIKAIPRQNLVERLDPNELIAAQKTFSDWLKQEVSIGF